MSNPNQAVTLTAEQLKDLMLTMAKELRKPADPTPEELAARETEAALRKETAKGQLARLEQKHQDQLDCTHLRTDGSTHTVYEYMGGYLICQGCQGIIRGDNPPDPKSPMAKEVSHHIFDRKLFLQHFKLSQAGRTTY